MSAENKSVELQGFWKDHSVAWKTSGLSQQEYCLQANISYRSFVYQHNRIASKLKKSTVNFVEAKPETVGVNNQTAVLQLMLPNGVRIGITSEANFTLIHAVLTVAGGL